MMKLQTLIECDLCDCSDTKTAGKALALAFAETDSEESMLQLQNRWSLRATFSPMIKFKPRRSFKRLLSLSLTTTLLVE